MYRECPSVLTLFILHEVVSATKCTNGFIEDSWLDIYATHPCDQVILGQEFHHVDHTSCRLECAVNLLTHELKKRLHLKLAFSVDVLSYRYLLPDSMLEYCVIFLIQLSVKELGVYAAAYIQTNVCRIDMCTHLAGEADDYTLTKVHVRHDSDFGTSAMRVIQILPYHLHCLRLCISGEDLTVLAKCSFDFF